MSPSDEKSPVGKKKLTDATTASAVFPHGTPVAATRGLEEAILTCTQKVEKIAKECRIANKKYRDFHFDLSLDGRYCLDGLTDEKPHLNPASTLRVGEVFRNPRFYKDGAKAGDIEKGETQDCWFLAAVATISNVPGLLERICVARDEAVGVYGFIFARDGEWVSTIVDDQLYITSPEYLDSDGTVYHGTEHDYIRDFMRGSKALHFAKCHDANETWLPLLEKAYAKAHGDYGAIEGGCSGEAVEDLTGGVTTEFLTRDLLDHDRFWNNEFSLVNKDFLFAAAISGKGPRSGIQVGHSYSVLRIKQAKGKKFVLVRNPCGKSEWTGAWSDGSKEWTAEWMALLGHQFGDDGEFWMSYSDFLHKFDHIGQTRLFDSTWTVTTHWAGVPVPWAMEYSATRFEVTVVHKGPVVFVLSKLDDRYFGGLQGQYEFEMHFRVHQDGEAEYITRSRSNVGMSRSVSTELELEPGKYTIVFKITAEKKENAKTMEQVIEATCKKDRKKFLQIGTSYDLAHAKALVEPRGGSRIKAAEASRTAKPVVVALTGKGGWGIKGSEGKSKKKKKGTGSSSDSSSSDSSSSSGSSSSSSDSSGSSSPSKSGNSKAPNVTVLEVESTAVTKDGDVWDAIACVGLRVYSKHKDLTVAVVHSDTVRDTDILDLDDLAQDAARDIERLREKWKNEKAEEGGDEKEGKKSKKGKKDKKKDKTKDKKKDKKKEGKEEEDNDEKTEKKDKKGGEKDKKDSKKKDKKKDKKDDKEVKDEKDEKTKDKKKKDKNGDNEKKDEKEKDKKKDKKEGGEDEKEEKKDKKEKDKKKDKKGSGEDEKEEKKDKKEKDKKKDKKESGEDEKEEKKDEKEKDKKKDKKESGKDEKEEKKDEKEEKDKKKDKKESEKDGENENQERKLKTVEKRGEVVREVEGGKVEAVETKQERQ